MDGSPENSGAMPQELIEAIEEDAKTHGFQEVALGDVFSPRVWLCPVCVCYVGNPRLHREVCSR